MKNWLVKAEGEIWLGYCGSLSDSYDLCCVFDALAMIKGKGLIPPKFIVMGHGEKMEYFVKYAAQKNIAAIFTGLLPYDQMCGVLKECDIAVNPIRGNSAGSIINKHADYAASGIPVINTQESEEYRQLIDAYQMGINCRNHDPKDLANKLIYLMSDIRLRNRMGRNARICAEEKFDREHSYKEIIEIL